MSKDDSVDIPINVYADKATKELKALAKDFEKVRKSADDFEKALKEASEQDEKRIQSIRKGYAEIAVSVYASVRAVEGFVSAMAEQEQQQSALDSLGNAYSEVSRQTAGTVSAVQALHVQNTLLQGNIPVTTRELGVITRAAREFARATRTDATAAIEQLTEALKKGEQEGLARFGLTADATKGKLENYIAGVRELERRQQGVSVSTRTLSEDTQLLGSHMQQFAGRVSTAISGPLSGLLDWYVRASGLSGTFRDRVMEVARALSGLDEETDAQRGRREQNNQRMALRERITRNYAATHGGQRIPLETSGRTLEQLQELDRATGGEGGNLINRRNVERTRAMLDNATGGTGGNSVVNAMLRRASGVRGVTVEEIARDQDSENTRRTQAARDAEQATQAGQRARMTRERHGGSSHRDTTVPTAIRKYQAEVAEAAIIGAPISPVGSPAQGENAADFWNTRAEWQEAANTSFRDHRTELSRVAHADEASRISNTRGKGEAAFAFARESTRLAGERNQRRATRDSATRRGANLESLGGRVSQGMGFDLDGEGNIAAFDAIKSGSELAIGSLQQLSQGFSGMFDAMAGGKSASEAFQVFISDTLSGLGKMAFNKGLFYTFEGLAALFTNPVAAPFLLASGVGLMALGGVLGYAGSATKPQVQQAPSSNNSARQVGSARNASGKTPGSNNSDMMHTTINMSSLTPPTPRDYQSIVYANRQANRYGLNSDARKAPRV